MLASVQAGVDIAFSNTSQTVSGVHAKICRQRIILSHLQGFVWQQNTYMIDGLCLANGME